MRKNKKACLLKEDFAVLYLLYFFKTLLFFFSIISPLRSYSMYYGYY